jgi:hypothetical protein
MWVKATKDEAQAARTNGKPVKFTSEGWMVEGGDARGPDTGDTPDTMTASDLTKEAEAVFSPLRQNPDGTWAANYVECDCGERYLVKAEHEKKSPRHKAWAKGEQVEVEVPKQPIPTAYPPRAPTPKLEVGVNKLCERCKAKNKKGESYYPDPDSKPDRRYPCRLCNGHGVRPNVG